MRSPTDQMARDTLAIIERGSYRAPSGALVALAPRIDAAKRGTRLYRPRQLRALVDAHPPAAGEPPRIELADETSTQAARRWNEQLGRRVVVLNFASARNPGGGFLNGAKAQEEDLCRHSALYPCLLTQPDYYQENRVNRSPLYTDHVIYSPDVPFFRDDDLALLDAPYCVSVITAPAPNTGAALQRGDVDPAAIDATFLRRARMVVAVALDNGHRHVVLGAWGCGAFHGDPTVAATAFAAALRDERVAGRLDAVCFPIPARGKRGRANHDAFRAVLG